MTEVRPPQTIPTTRDYLLLIESDLGELQNALLRSSTQIQEAMQLMIDLLKEQQDFFKEELCKFPDISQNLKQKEGGSWDVETLKKLHDDHLIL